MSILSVFIASQNLIVHIVRSSADRVSSETIGFVPKYSFTICRDYSESFDQISSERMIHLFGQLPEGSLELIEIPGRGRLAVFGVYFQI
jgi:hypothetical protein